MNEFSINGLLSLKLDPSSLSKLQGDLKSQLGSLGNIQGLDNLTRSLNEINGITKQTADNFKMMAATSSILRSNAEQLTGSLNPVSQALKNTSTEAAKAGSIMQSFGVQAGLAIRRYGAFVIAARGFYGLVGALETSIGKAIEFDREMIKLGQVTGQSTASLQGFKDEISNLSTNLGVSSEELVKVAVKLTSAGLSATETQNTLKTLAQLSLSPAVKNIESVADSLLALRAQFNLTDADSQKALNSINAIALKFGGSVDEILAAAKRSGGIFDEASQGIGTSLERVQEFAALVQAVKSQNRQAGETIGASLGLVFSRLQRADTLHLLRQYNIELTDLQGHFVGLPIAIQKLAEGLNSLSSGRSVEFANIVEKLGGARQIRNILPLLTNPDPNYINKILDVGKNGTNSAAEGATRAQESLSVQIGKTREEFEKFIRDVVDSQTFRAITSLALGAANAFIKMADSIRGILPVLAALGAVSILRGAPAFFGGVREGLSRISQLGVGKAAGGIIPGSGSGDHIPIMAEPGEFMIKKSSAQAIGYGTLRALNRYAKGGIIKGYADGDEILPSGYHIASQSRSKPPADAGDKFIQQELQKKGLTLQEYEKQLELIKSQTQKDEEILKLKQRQAELLSTQSIDVNRGKGVNHQTTIGTTQSILTLGHPENQSIVTPLSSDQYAQPFSVNTGVRKNINPFGNRRTDLPADYGDQSRLAEDYHNEAYYNSGRSYKQPTGQYGPHLDTLSTFQSLSGFADARRKPRIDQLEVTIAERRRRQELRKQGQYRLVTNGQLSSNAVPLGENYNGINEPVNEAFYKTQYHDVQNNVFTPEQAKARYNLVQSFGNIPGEQYGPFQQQGFLSRQTQRFLPTFSRAGSAIANSKLGQGIGRFAGGVNSRLGGFGGYALALGAGQVAESLDAPPGISGAIKGGAGGGLLAAGLGLGPFGIAAAVGVTAIKGFVEDIKQAQLDQAFKGLAEASKAAQNTFERYAKGEITAGQFKSETANQDSKARQFNKDVLDANGSNQNFSVNTLFAHPGQALKASLTSSSSDQAGRNPELVNAFARDQRLESASFGSQIYNQNLAKSEAFNNFATDQLKKGVSVSDIVKTQDRQKLALSGSRGEEYAQNIANIRANSKNTGKDLEKELAARTESFAKIREKELRQEDEAIQKQTKLGAALDVSNAAVDSLIDRLNQFGYATKRAADLQEVHQTGIENVYQGVSGQFGLSKTTPQFQVLQDIKSYSADQVGTQLGQFNNAFGTGFNTKSGGIVGNKRLEAALPGILAQAGGLGESGQQLDFIKKSLGGFGVSNELQDQIYNKVRVRAEGKGPEVIKELANDSGFVKGLNPLSEKGNEVVQAAVKQLLEIQETYRKNIQQYYAHELEITRERVTIDEKIGQFAIARSQREGRIVTPEQERAGLLAGVSRLTGGTTSVNQIQGNILEERRHRDTIVAAQQNPNLSQGERQNLTNKEAEYNAKLASNTEALKLLANSTAGLQAINQELARIQSQREGGRGTLESLFNSSPEERAKLAIGARVSARLEQTGQTVIDPRTGKKTTVQDPTLSREEIADTLLYNKEYALPALDRSSSEAQRARAERKRADQDRILRRAEGFDNIDLDNPNNPVAFEVGQTRTGRPIGNQGGNAQERRLLGQANAIENKAIQASNFLADNMVVKNLTIESIKQAANQQAGQILNPANLENLSKALGGFDTGTQQFAQSVIKFNGIADKLAQVKIPDKISLNAVHEVNVTFNGAQALADMKPEIQKLVLAQVKTAIDDKFDPITGEFRGGKNRGNG